MNPWALEITLTPSETKWLNLLRRRVWWPPIGYKAKRLKALKKGAVVIRKKSPRIKIKEPHVLKIPVPMFGPGPF